ncbi:metallophosphoesterase [Endozoicomonas arenosclerae]|uniref:metallophosphoesterase n=1 Tax=Endozoicomonas arenosclerae TaxID=1633495 RepID=UPI000B1734A0|nr:metallophosphoesterase [Endozoicomonas arenosclerae]
MTTHTPSTRRVVFSAVLSLSVALTGCATQDEQAGYDPNKTYSLTVLHTNDHHGRFWQNEDGEWGMAARKTLIDDIREEVESKGGDVLLLSGGDINTGVPESDLQDAVPDFSGMNMIGYDAMAVGNHEFDNSIETLRMQEQLADFPFLSANIYETESDERLFKPYKIFQVNDLKVAVLGLTTDDTAKVALADNIEGIEFRSPIEEAEELVPELKDKADIIIASTHMGHYQNARHGANAPGDVTLAREVDDIDLIVGGHSQNPLFKPDQQNDT